MTRQSTGARAVAALLFVLATGIAAPAVGAQGGVTPGQQRPPAQRAQLEQRFRERLATVVQQRLQLDDAQMTRLRQTNAVYEPKRRALLQQERAVRQEIRAQVAGDSAADQQRVAELIQRAIGLQRQRLDLVEAEQKDLAQFLTPVQRARYLDLQEKLRQRVEQLRRQQRQQQQGDGGARGGRRAFRP